MPPSRHISSEPGNHDRSQDGRRSSNWRPIPASMRYSTLRAPHHPLMADETKFENRLNSEFDPQSQRAQANRAALTTLLSDIRTEEESMRLGGGEKAVEAQHGKGRLTVRERLSLLLDEGADFLELGLWAARGMYEEYGGAPAAGVVTGLGRVSGRLCMIVAN